MSEPSPLPFELTDGIICIATADLVDEERYLIVPTASPTNAFLRAASLVSKTWRSIAQPALLRNGLVNPRGTKGFLEQLRRRAIVASTVTVRFGAGGRGRLAGDEATNDGEALMELVETLLKLQKLEVIGPGLVFSSSARLAARGVAHIVLVNQTYTDCISILAYFMSSPPSHLTVLDDLGREAEEEEILVVDSVRTLSAVFDPIKHFYVHSPQLGWMMSGALIRVGVIPGRRLESLHLQSSNPFTIYTTQRLNWGKETRLTSLTHLSTHLRLLSRTPTSRPRPPPPPPTLTSIQILADPAVRITSQLDPKLDEEAEETLLSMISQIPALESLAVPSRWTCDSVTKACEAKGIALIWTADESSRLLRTSMPSIDRLSPEILSRVLELAGRASIVQASLVCREWREAAQGVLFGDVSLKTPDTLRGWFLQAARRRNHIYSLVLDLPIDPGSLSQVIQSLGGIRALTMSAPTDWSILTSPTLNDLEHLHLIYRFVLEEESIEPSFAVPFQLQKLELDSGTILPRGVLASLFRASSTSLVSLKATTNIIIYQTDPFEHLIPHLPHVAANLRHLAIGFEPFPTSLLPLLPLFTKLSSLEIDISLVFHTTKPHDYLGALCAQLGGALAPTVTLLTLSISSITKITIPSYIVPLVQSPAFVNLRRIVLPELLEQGSPGWAFIGPGLVEECGRRGIWLGRRI